MTPGVAMGHLHYQVRDVEANKAFWIALGGEAAESGDATVVAFPDVLVRIDPGETSGGTEGSVVNHVAFRVRSVADIEAGVSDVHHNEAFPGVASVFTPEGERIELFDDELATNLGFSVDDGEIGPVADRHNRALTVPIVAHHIHLYVPEGDVIEARDWYAGHFGGVVGKRWRYDAVDLPGINLNFSGVPAPLAATEGRMLDHIGFEVENLEAFCASPPGPGPYPGSTLHGAVIRDRKRLTDGSLGHIHRTHRRSARQTVAARLAGKTSGQDER